MPLPQHRRPSRKYRRSRPLLEVLEDRYLLAASMVPIPSISTAGSNPSNLTAVGNTLCFMADDGSHDVELWKSDGSAAGTVLVKDFGPAGTAVPQGFTASHGRLFFTFNDGTHGDELWQSDGTAAGTTLVTDINPGPGSANPSQLTDVNGTLFFTADDGTHGPSLWKTDGTMAGTVLVQQGPASWLTPVGSHLFFVGSDAAGKSGLCETDGTPGAAVLLTDATFPQNLVADNGTVFFIGPDFQSGPLALWKSDGTPAGTGLLVDLPAVGGIDELTAVGGRVFFTVPGNQPWTNDLWTSDGTAAGTVALMTSSDGSSVDHLTVSGGKLYFVDNAGPIAGAAYIGTSDGTAAGTKDLLSFEYYENGGNDPPSYLTDVNGTLYFAADNYGTGTELWTTTGLVADIFPGTYGWGIHGPFPNSSSPDQLTNVNGTLFFTADDGVHGRELWESGAGGTVMVKDICTTPDGSPSPSGFTAINGQVFFTATDGSVPGDFQLWQTDGTAAGTVDVADNGIGWDPHDLVRLGNTLVFTAEGRTAELWAFAGSPGSAQLLQSVDPPFDPEPDPPSVFDPFDQTVAGNTLYFASWNGGSGSVLWQTDGTLAGTGPAVYAGSGTQIANASDLADVAGTLFFVADGGVHGPSLWEMGGGSSSGATLVLTLNSLSPNASPGESKAVGNTLYFSTTDSKGQGSLWKSDGTAQGTTLVAPNTFAGGISNMTDVDGTLYFSTGDGSGGEELWRTDGTAAGTVMLNDFTGSNVPSLWDFTAVGQRLFFTEILTNGNTDLWTSDGTPQGTADIRSFYSPDAIHGPAYLTGVGNTLWFAADDGVHGRELWQSDGTAAGTVMAQDIQPGPGGSDPQDLTNINGSLWFSADDGTHGRQAWQEAVAPPLTASAGGPYAVTEGGSLSLQANASSPASGLPTYAWDINGEGNFTDATGPNPTLSWAQLRALGLDGGNTYSVRVRVTDSLGTTVTSAPVTLAVQDAPLAQVVALPVRATEGAAFSGAVASFFDPGGSDPAMHYTASIDWGDGTTSAGTVGPSGYFLRAFGSHTYAHAGSYTVRATVAHGAGPVTATEAVQVADAPLYARGGSYRLTAGVAYSGPVASFHDTDPLAAAGDYQAAVAWGDGSTSAGVVASDGKGGFAVSGGHTYTAAGQYTAVVQIQDVGGSAATASTLLAVRAPSLTASAGGPYTVTEGSSLGLRATAVGSAGGPLSYAWDVNGDGTFSDATGASPTLSWAQLRALGLDGGSTYSVRVRVADSLGDTVTSAPVTLAVRDVPLQRMAALPVRPTEGAAFSGAVASFLDPGGSDPAAHYRATIAWGDGTTTAGTVGPSGYFLRVWGSHTYAHAGSYAVRVTVADAAGSVVAAEAVQVADAPLYARGSSYGATAGVAYAGPVVSFHDADPQGTARDYRALIAWGDGSTLAGVVASDGKGGFVVGGRHTYAAAGRYTVVVQIQDPGSSATAARTLLIVSAPPHVRRAPVPRAVRRQPPQPDGEVLPLGQVA